MLLKKLFLITFCVLVCIGANSQGNFKPAYIINHGGDTVKGLIDYRNWDKNPEKISFRSSIGSSEDYFPLAIKSFYVEGNYFESAIVDVEESATLLQDLGYGHELVFKKDTVFLQKLIEGPKSLYACVLRSSKEQFYIKKDNEFELLGFKKYRKTTSEGIFDGTNSLYLNQLNLYCNDCPDAMKFLEGVKYRRKDLVGFFKKYYKCLGKEIDSEYQVDRPKLEAGAILGYTLTAFNLNGDGDFDNIDFSKSSSVTGGLFFDLRSAKGLGKFSFYNELVYSYYKINGSSNFYVNENNYASADYTLEYSYLKINSMARYRFGIGDRTLFLNGGVGNGFMLVGKDEFVGKRKYYSSEQVYKGEAFPNPDKHEFSFLLGFGASIKRTSFEIRMETGSGVSPYSGLKTVVNRAHFLFAYRF